MAAEKRLLVISIDAMVEEDLEILRGLKNLGPVLGSSAIVRKNLSTYPTMTHAVHTSIMTGCWPCHHGVPGNEQFEPGNLRCPWYEHYAWVRRPSLPEIAERQNLRSAFIFWPLTIGAPVSWVLHRASIHQKIENEDQIVAGRSTPGLVEKLWPEIRDTFKGTWENHYVESDRRSCLALSSLYRTEQPDVAYMHLIDLDHRRHKGGVFGPHIAESLGTLDSEIGMVFDALKAGGLWDSTIIAITADHGQIDIDRVVAINRFFADNGLLFHDAEGNLLAWNAYAHAQGMSVHVYVRDRDPEVLGKTRRLLEDNMAALGIGDILTGKEARDRYHISGSPDLVLDTDGHSSFTSKFAVPLYSNIDDSDYRYSHATHGYMPEKGAQPVFFVRNPFTRNTSVLENARIIDQMPTLARMLGLRGVKCDGRVLKELL